MEKEISSYGLEVARIKPFFTGSVRSKLGHYRKISVTLCFSKILEHIIYNHIYKYLLEHKILYSKQFGLQFGHSTDHAITQFVDQIFEAFENNLYTLAVFIVFDRVDHSILLKKFELYSIWGNNLIWIKIFLSKRKQYIEIDPRAKTSLELVNYGVPQELILAHLLFFLHVNDLKNASTLLDLIMFADDTNFFHTPKNTLSIFWCKRGTD